MKVNPSVKSTRSIAISSTSLESDSFFRGLSFTWLFALRSALYFVIPSKFRLTTAWMRFENFKTQILPLVVSIAAAVSWASIFFEEFTEAKADRKLLPAEKKQRSIVWMSFNAQFETGTETSSHRRNVALSNRSVQIQQFLHRSTLPVVIRKSSRHWRITQELKIFHVGRNPLGVVHSVSATTPKR